MLRTLRRAPMPDKRHRLIGTTPNVRHIKNYGSTIIGREPPPADTTLTKTYDCAAFDQTLNKGYSHDV